MRFRSEFTVLSLLIVFCVAMKDNPDGTESESSTSDPVQQRIQNLQRQGSEYLEKVMSQLHNDRVQNDMIEVPDDSIHLYTLGSSDDVYNDLYKGVTPEYNISGPTPVPEIEAESGPEVPPLELSKEELLALYQAAVEKAAQLKLLESGHKPEQDNVLWEENAQVKPSLQGQMEGPLSGYYYYYFPIKSFLKQKEHLEGTSTASVTPSSVTKVTSNPTQHLHATVTMIDSPNKSVEPLFMAISSFIGMALMFFLSVIFVPKFSKIRSKNAEFKDPEEDMNGFGQIILQTMAGRDCSERLGCEIARIFRGLRSDNKTLRVLEIVLPPNLSKQVSYIRRAAGKRGKCNYILCTDKKVKSPASNSTIKIYKPRPWKEKATPHELWMSHFEGNKRPLQPIQQKYGSNRPNSVKKT